MRKCVKVMLIFSNGDYEELSRESGISLDDIHEFINAKCKPVEPLIKDEKAREAVAEDAIEYLKSENAYLRGKIEVYEKFLKDRGYIKEEE